MLACLQVLRRFGADLREDVLSPMGLPVESLAEQVAASAAVTEEVLEDGCMINGNCSEFSEPDEMPSSILLGRGRVEPLELLLERGLEPVMDLNVLEDHVRRKRRCKPGNLDLDFPEKVHACVELLFKHGAVPQDSSTVSVDVEAKWPGTVHA